MDLCLIQRCNAFKYSPAAHDVVEVTKGPGRLRRLLRLQRHLRRRARPPREALLHLCGDAGMKLQLVKDGKIKLSPYMRPVPKSFETLNTLVTGSGNDNLTCSTGPIK
uniref:Uncharacterized protein n=1 Tax=Oryza brachyantha TaxID=4533 RepID=J3MQ84_ORYBR